MHAAQVLEERRKDIQAHRHAPREPQRAPQIARAIGARAIGTARTDAKLERCRELGMHALQLYTEVKNVFVSLE